LEVQISICGAFLTMKMVGSCSSDSFASIWCVRLLEK
jgi:hypothetical protein